MSDYSFLILNLSLYQKEILENIFQYFIIKYKDIMGGLIL
jgi:hypothetical protein